MFQTLTIFHKRSSMLYKSLKYKRVVVVVFLHKGINFKLSNKHILSFHFCADYQHNHTYSS